MGQHTRIEGESESLNSLSNTVTPPSAATSRAHEAFLNQVVFSDLEEILPSFDSPAIKHFTAADFHTVVDHCTAVGVLIIAIEVFTHDARLVDVCFDEAEQASNEWCLTVLARYRQRRKLQFCATYRVPASAMRV